jgi:hypothetical protein
MCIEAFHKVLYQLPVSQPERAALTADELFVLTLARRLDCLTAQGRKKLSPEDLRDLAVMGLIAGDGGFRAPAAAVGRCK